MANAPDEPVDEELERAFRAGIQASENYDSSMTDARRVIDEFGRGVNKLTSGRISVELRPTIIEQTRYLSNMMLAALGGPPPPEKIKTHGLFVRGRVGEAATNERRLCLVHFDTAVFPVELDWDGGSVSCPTSTDLVVGLRKLLTDAHVAKKLRIIMVECDAFEAKQLAPPSE